MGNVREAFAAKLDGNDVVDLPSNMMAPFGAYHRYHTCAVLPLQVTPLVLVTLTVGQYAVLGHVGGGVPASFCGAPDSDRFRLPPEVPSAFVVPAYGSCTVVMLVFSAIASGHTSSVVSVGLFSVNPARNVVAPVLLMVTVFAVLTVVCPEVSVTAAVIWCDPLKLGASQSCVF